MNDRDRKPHVDDRFVDELLDASLARAVEPRAGLEGRILTRVRAEREAQPRFGWTWRVAVGVAVLVVASLVARVALRPNPRPPAAVSRPAAPELVVQSPTGRQVAHEPALRHEPRVRRLGRGVLLASSERRPKVFPSPRPLSEEEKLLLHARDVPAGVLLAWNGNPDALRDLEIKELDIPPLGSETPPNSGTEQK